jgi:hypothetical protein
MAPRLRLWKESRIPPGCQRHERNTGASEQPSPTTVGAGSRYYLVGDLIYDGRLWRLGQRQRLRETVALL